MRRLRTFALHLGFLAGAGLLVAGFWAWWPPAALMFAGAFSMALAFAIARNDTRGGPEE